MTIRGILVNHWRDLVSRSTGSPGPRQPAHADVAAWPGGSDHKLSAVLGPVHAPHGHNRHQARQGPPAVLEPVKPLNGSQQSLSHTGLTGKKWGDLEFPLPFGRTMSAAEERVHAMDGKTGASLKLSILNPKVRGRWPCLEPGDGIACSVMLQEALQVFWVEGGIQCVHATEHSQPSPSP